MSLVAQLRSHRAPVEVAGGAGAIGIRVQAASMWDAIGMTVRPDTPAAEVKRRALSAFFPQHEFADDYLLKFRGWEILDETQPLSAAGVMDGSILLLTHRRRHPVR